jgi:hypothetical protein
MKISTQDKQKHLEEQLSFIEQSAENFDNGTESEIKRLAVSIRIIVHDTRNSTSLLSSLNKKNINFLDTSIPYDDTNIISHSGLIRLKLPEGKNLSKPVPLFDKGKNNNMVPFDTWWNGIVLVDREKNKFTRRDIVLTLANKEGGAHIDEEIDDSYFNLRKNNALEMFDVTPEGKTFSSADQVPASMRQIAHEILKTLKKDYTYHNKHIKGTFVSDMKITEPSRNQPIQVSKFMPIRKKKVGRNERCPCGSKKKYKNCCLGK